MAYRCVFSDEIFVRSRRSLIPTPRVTLSPLTDKGFDMAQITYRIVEHDGGWAYQLGSTYSETYPDHESATAAARRAAGEQKVPDADACIEYQNSHGEWVTERADGQDRPSTAVEE